MVDDHVLLRNSLARVIENFENCEVILEANNGHELLTRLDITDLPDVVLLDLNMPVMDGFETAAWLCSKHPSVHILMLTMYESDQVLIRLLQAGAKGFLKKDIHPDELNVAIRSVVQSGFYCSPQVSGKMANFFRSNNGADMILEKTILTELEIDFLKLACSDLTYKEVAMKMRLNPRAVDGLRDSLFEKLQVKSRVGLVMWAIRQGIVAL